MTTNVGFKMTSLYMQVIWNNLKKWILVNAARQVLKERGVKQSKWMHQNCTLAYIAMKFRENLSTPFSR